MKKMNMSAWKELFSNEKDSDKNEVSGVNHSSGDNRRPKICCSPKNHNLKSFWSTFKLSMNRF